MKYLKTIGISASLLALTVCGVVIAKDMNNNAEKQKALTGAFPQKNATDESCSAENDSFLFSSCFFGKLRSNLEKGSVELNKELSPVLGQNGADAVSNVAVGMTGMLAFGEKCFSGVTSGLMSLVPETKTKESI